MGTTAEKLQAILDTKAGLKTAIEAKGVTVGDAVFSDYPTLVGNISGGSTLITKTMDTNGTYNASSDNADGYSQVTVAVPSAGNKLPQYFNKTLTSLEPSDFGGVTQCPGFHGCTSLVSVELANTITSIPGYGFHQTGITSIKIPSSVTTIGVAAFYECYYLPEIVLPISISSIANYAFSICIQLKKIILLSTTCTLDDVGAFSRAGERVGGYTVYVTNPNDYRVATNWVAIANNIFPLVATVADLTNIDTTTYTKACVTGTDESYKEYTYDGTQWNEVTA